MENDKLTEFATVMLFALIVGVGVWLIFTYLEGTSRAVAIIALGAAVIIAWQYLRRRFERG